MGTVWDVRWNSGVGMSGLAWVSLLSIDMGTAPDRNVHVDAGGLWGEGSVTQLYVPWANWTGPHPCASATVKQSVEAASAVSQRFIEQQTPDENHYREAKQEKQQRNTLFLKYVLHLWYSLMTISILLLRHFPSVAAACGRKGETGGEAQSKEVTEETKWRLLTRPSVKRSRTGPELQCELYLGRTVNVRAHRSIQGSHKVTNRIVPFGHIWRGEDSGNDSIVVLQTHTAFGGIVAICSDCVRAISC